MELFPPMPLDEWRETKETLHRFTQVVGKIRLAASVRRNHWWNVPFHLTGRGLTTRPMGLVDGNPVFTVDLDLVDHRLVVTVADGRTASFPLPGHSVASFHRQTLETLTGLGIRVELPFPMPYRLPDSDRPFAEDDEHATYDPVLANRAWQVLGQVALVLEEFSARFSGKASPVHFFWHSFDLAHTRFSGRALDRPATGGPGDPRGVLPGADQLRLLVRGRRPGRAGLLLLHGPRAGATGRGSAGTRRRPVGGSRMAATWPSCATRRRVRRPTRGRPCSPSTRPRTGPVPSGPAGTSSGWPARVASRTPSGSDRL